MITTAVGAVTWKLVNNKIQLIIVIIQLITNITQLIIC